MERQFDLKLVSPIDIETVYRSIDQSIKLYFFSPNVCKQTGGFIQKLKFSLRQCFIFYFFYKSTLCSSFNFRVSRGQKLHFLPQFHIKDKSWHSIKPWRKTTGAKQHFKTVHICGTRRTHVELQKANISQILRLRQCEVKTLVGLGNWTQYKAEVNENHSHYVIASPDLTQPAIFSPVDKKNMGGKHGNADMLWALNALKQQLFCIIHSYMRDNPSLGKMSQICRSDVSLKNILCYE